MRAEDRSQRKARLVDAIEKCPDSAELMVEVAKAFWEDRKIEKARLWFQKSLACARKWGDAAIAFYCFELQQSDSQAAELQQLGACEFKRGVLWEQTDAAQSMADRIVQGALLAQQSLLRE